MDTHFTAIYRHATRSLMDVRDRIGLHVLLELANHADPAGFCWPGSERISNLVGYAVESVDAALDRLEAAKFIRKHVQYNPMRRREESMYQVSPYVLAIENKYRTVAFEYWEKPAALMDSVMKESQRPNNEVQPERTQENTTRETTPVNNTSKKHQTAESGPQTALSGMTPGAHYANEVQNQLPNLSNYTTPPETEQREAPHLRPNTPGSAAPPLDLVGSIQRVAPALHHERIERFIDQYGREAVTLAFDILKAGAPADPAAYFVGTLKKVAGKQPVADRRVSRSYDDFIQE